MGPAQEKLPQSSYRWAILVAVCIMGFMTVGTRSTLGNFLKTIITDLHWDRGTISFVVAVNLWLSGLLQPFAGHLLDRFGARGLFATSVALYALGFGLSGLANSMVYLLIVYGLVMGAASAGVSTTLTNTLVAQWFREWRGLAIGINNAAAALGQLALVYVSFLLLQSHGWRLSYLYLGGAVLMVSVPMALLIPRRGLIAGGSTGAPGRRTAVHGPLETTSWRQALCSAPLWQINAGYFVCGMTVALFSTHLIPFATDRGFSPATAAKAFSLMTGLSALGSLLAGAISDRLGRKNVLALAYLVRAGTFAMLLLWQHELALYAFAAIGGLVWLATPPSVIALTGEIYGMRSLGKLGGISLLAHQIGGGASVWLAGVLHDLTGNYDISFTLAAVALVGAALVSFSIAERRYSVRYMPAPSAAAGG
jgi:MFS family permease